MTTTNVQDPTQEATGTDEAMAIVAFAFDGDTLDIAAGAGEAHAVVRRVCDVLGVSFQGQVEKLRSDETFAEGLKIILTPSAGGSQEMLCIDVRLLPLWLATIHPSKVKAAVRPKLIRYKKQCGEALADHFLGRRGSADMNPLACLRVLVNTALDRGKLGCAIAHLNAARGMGMDGWVQLGLFAQSRCVRGGAA